MTADEVRQLEEAHLLIMQIDVEEIDIYNTKGEYSHSETPILEQ